MNALATAAPALPEVAALQDVKAALRALLATSTGPSFSERASVNSALLRAPETDTRRAISAYMSRWSDSAQIGSISVRVVDIPPARAALVSDGAELFALIDDAIAEVTKRHDTEAENLRRRRETAHQLRTRPETADLIRAYEGLRKAMGPSFDPVMGSPAWPHHYTPSIQPGFFNAVRAVLLWASDQGRPYPLGFQNAADLEQLLAEYPEGR